MFSMPLTPIPGRTPRFVGASAGGGGVTLSPRRFLCHGICDARLPMKNPRIDDFYEFFWDAGCSLHRCGCRATWGDADFAGYGQETWDAGPDKPYFTSLFSAVRDGTAFAGAGASLDLTRVVVSGYNF